eukprot:4127165-Prymnesium_polylepis.1
MVTIIGKFSDTRYGCLGTRPARPKRHDDDDKASEVGRAATPCHAVHAAWAFQRWLPSSLRRTRSVRFSVQRRCCREVSATAACCTQTRLVLTHRPCCRTGDEALHGRAVYIPPGAYNFALAGLSLEAKSPCSTRVLRVCTSWRGQYDD